MSVKNWAHLDIAGVMTSNGESTFLRKGMSGTLSYFYSSGCAFCLHISCLRSVLLNHNLVCYNVIE